MSLPAQAASSEGATEFLEGLRSRYEALGFKFTAEPDRSMLPAFMGSYTPDALAQKPGRNIAIEIKSRQSLATEARLQDIRRLFEKRPDWEFTVFIRGADSPPTVTIPKGTPVAVRRRIDEVRELVEQGHRRPAYVMAWSLVEAALQAVTENGQGKPLTPGALVQTLATDGYISPDMERRMRGLIALRNQIVHGDVVAEPTADDVNDVLSAAEETLQVGVS